MPSVCDIGLNPSLRKINVNTVKHVLLYRIHSSCKLLLIIIIHVNNDVIIIPGMVWYGVYSFNISVHCT